MDDARQAQLDAVLTSESVDLAAYLPSEITGSVRRVAIFTEAFLPKVDGVSRTALLTIKYLQSTGRELIVFAPAPAIPRIGPTPVYAIPSLWAPDVPETRIAPPWPFLLPRLRHFAPDLIHLFSPASLGAIGMLAGSWLHTPVIATYQTDLPGYTGSYGYGSLRGMFIDVLRYIHNGCHLTLAPSKSTLAELAGWGFRRLRLWERGVDSARFHPRRRSQAWRERLLAGRSQDRLLVLYVGRMAREKHLETLRLVTGDPDLALTLIGGGSYRDEVRRVLSRNGGDPHFMGYLIGDDLADAYAAADVFVFPGPEETFGQVVLEAMASGLPIVVSDRGGPQTLVREGTTGYICPGHSAKAFAERVRKLRDNPELRRQMGKQARSDAESRPWLAVMRQLERHYAEAVRLHKRWRRRVAR